MRTFSTTPKKVANHSYLLPLVPGTMPGDECCICQTNIVTNYELYLFVVQLEVDLDVCGM